MKKNLLLLSIFLSSVSFAFSNELTSVANQIETVRQEPVKQQEKPKKKKKPSAKKAAKPTFNSTRSNREKTN
jgi:hypothetical protein